MAPVRKIKTTTMVSFYRTLKEYRKTNSKVQYNARVRVLNFRETPLQPDALEILGWKATIFNKIIP